MALQAFSDTLYGYDIASQEYNLALVDAVRAQDLGRLLEFDLD